MLYKDPIIDCWNPLIDTNGILFPYTPTISVSHTAQYTGAHPPHSNYVQHSYNASSVDAINIDGYFTANNSDEARYVFAVLHFYEVHTKCFLVQMLLEQFQPCLDLVDTDPLITIVFL